MREQITLNDKERKRLAKGGRVLAAKHGLYIANADGTGIRKPADHSFSTYRGWSLDGEWIAFRADCRLSLNDDKPHDGVGQGEDG